MYGEYRPPCLDVEKNLYQNPLKQFYIDLNILSKRQFYHKKKCCDASTPVPSFSSQWLFALITFDLLLPVSSQKVNDLQYSTTIIVEVFRHRQRMDIRMSNFLVYFKTFLFYFKTLPMIQHYNSHEWAYLTKLRKSQLS